jgi:hypothetical protein
MKASHPSLANRYGLTFMEAMLSEASDVMTRNSICDYVANGHVDIKCEAGDAQTS